MKNLITQLLIARNVAHMWHWKVKSFAQHLALGELYDGLSEMSDALMEMYMGRYGTEGPDTHIELSQPNSFSEQDPVEFVRQLDSFLEGQHDQIVQDKFIVNKFEELQGMVSTIKYKLENLH
jgi:DNA-binding ferritin-like protein